MIPSALLALWRIVGWRGLLVAAVIAAGAWWHLNAVSDAYDRGAQAVRVEWAEVNQAEAELIAVQTQAAMRRRALEAALEAERADESKPVVDRSVCRLPDGVRKALQY